MVMKANYGMPGIGVEAIARHRTISADGIKRFVPVGGIISGTKCRDANNDDIHNIRAGTLMGKIASGGKWANSFFGTLQAALATGATLMTILPAEAVELVRRIGASGWVSLLGPGQAGGVAQSSILAYSAVNTSTGAVTITATGVNQVDQFLFATPATAGNLQLTIQRPDGSFITTASAAWNATDATYISNLNTQLDAASGTTGGIVASAIAATDTDLGFVLTYSGAAYAKKTWTAAVVALLPTGATAPAYTRTTNAAAGNFAAGSLVGDTDGSQVPISFIGDGWGEFIAPDSTGIRIDQPWPYIPLEAVVNTAQLLPAATDAGILTYIRNALRSSSGQFSFADLYVTQ